jgi:uncharacterized protein
VSAAWLVPLVTAGIFGSAHCIGMCGGLIAVASDGASTGRERLRVQLGYQSARLASYVALGVAAGWLGRALDLAGQAAGLGKTAAVVAGATMTLGGLWAMLEAGGARLSLRLPQARLPRFVASSLASVRRRPPLVRAALLGGASAFLPCGFLYAFALAAAGTGSPLSGGLVMAALWLGNLPALLGFGLVVAGALAGVRRHVPLLSATAVFALGMFTLSSRVNLPALALGAAAPAAHSATAPMPADCPYHRKQPQ